MAVRGDAVGVAWYGPALFTMLKQRDDALVAAFDDWDEWFASYQRAFVQIKEQGHSPRKVVIDGAALVAWLKGSGRSLDEAALADFVAHRLEAIVAGQGA